MTLPSSSSSGLLRQILVLCLLLLAPGLARGEYILYKSEKGVLIVSDNPGAFFSFDVPGEKIAPADLESSPHPRLFADAFYLEIIPISLVEGEIPASREDELKLLNSHFTLAKTARAKPPSDIYSQELELELADKIPALSWNFIPYGEKPTERFYCLVFRSEKTLFLLKAGFAEAPTQADPAEFLQAIANSFIRSDKPIAPPRPAEP